MKIMGITKQQTLVKRLSLKNGCEVDAHPEHVILCQTLNISTGVAKMIIAQWGQNRIETTRGHARTLLNKIKNYGS